MRLVAIDGSGLITRIAKAGSDMVAGSTGVDSEVAIRLARIGSGMAMGSTEGALVATIEGSPSNSLLSSKKVISSP